MIDIRPLSYIRNHADVKKQFVERLIRLLETQPEKMGAVKGLIIKKTYAAVQSIRPHYVEHVVTVLTQDYLQAYENFHQIYIKSQNLPAQTYVPFYEYVKTMETEYRQIFWEIADRYAQRHKGRFLGTLYSKFRPTIEEHLPEIIREVCILIDEFTVTGK